jgi:hypothetical protein
MANYSSDDDNYIEEIDNKLDGGKTPSDCLPLRKRDIIQAIIRFYFSLEPKEYAILHTYCSSGFQIDYTTKLHNISRSRLYEIIDRAYHIYTDALVHRTGHSKK